MLTKNNSPVPIFVLSEIMFIALFLRIKCNDTGAIIVIY
jgi:hypothetical protein